MITNTATATTPETPTTQMPAESLLGGLDVPPGPMSCTTRQQRAAREAATMTLFRRAENCSAADRDVVLARIVELNLDMARGLARRFRGRGADLDDLEQVAMLGLVKAAHHYRLSADTPFIGFAIPTVRGEIKKYFRDAAWTVRIPRRLQDLQGRLAAKTPELEQRLQREPTRAELAAELGEPESEVTAALPARGCFNVLSLDRPADESDDLFLADAVADHEDPTLEQLEAIEVLQPVLAELSDRDKTVLRLRFVEGWNQRQIGDEIGVSQMQISRILKAILATLRNRLTPPLAA